MNYYFFAFEECYATAKVTLTSILDGSGQVKNMKVPFLSGRPSKMARNVDKADSSVGLGDLILGEIASFKASQKVLPSTSLTSTICNDFSKDAAVKKNYVNNPPSLFHQGKCTICIVSTCYIERLC